MAGHVEEVLALEVGRELGVPDVDAVRPDRSLDALERAIAGLDPALEAGELAPEGRDAEVLDLEADRRMDRIDVPGPGRKGYGCLLGCRCHADSFLLRLHLLVPQPRRLREVVDTSTIASTISGMDSAL